MLVQSTLLPWPKRLMILSLHHCRHSERWGVLSFCGSVGSLALPRSQGMRKGCRPGHDRWLRSTCAARISPLICSPQSSGKGMLMQAITSPSHIVAEAPSVQRPTRARRKKMRRVGMIMLFLLPSLILYFVFIFFPVIQAAYYSFYHWSGLGPLTDFAGLANYATAFKSMTFL